MQQEVKLIYNSPLKLAIDGARICYNSFDKSDTKPCTECVGIGKAVYFSEEEEIAVKCSTCGGEGFIYGEKDKNLIKKLIKKGHTSVIEHVVYTFSIKGISRVCSHQLVRHRIASYSQQSHRYVKVDKDSFVEPESIKKSKYTKLLWDNYLDTVFYLYDKFIDEGMLKEDARFILPNAVKTELIMTINARSLRNFFQQRLDKESQWEIRELASKMLDLLPKVHKEILFNDL